MPKNWCFWTVVLEKTLGSPLDCKEIKPVNPKGNQSWIFMGRTDAEAETPVLWPPDELTPWKRPWCWERWKVGGERDDSGLDGITDLTDRSLRRLWGWWWTGKTAVLQSLVAKSQTWLRDRTELSWKNYRFESMFSGSRENISLRLIMMVIW